MGGTNNEMVTRAVWGGVDTPFPIGMWYGESQVSVVTGSGKSTLTLLFSDILQPEINSQLYNLEQFNVVRSGDASAFTGILRTLNLGINPSLAGSSQGPLAQTWAIPTGVGADTGFTASFGRDIGPIKHVFLGAQINKLDRTGLEFTADENINNFSLAIVAMGYIWSSRARSILGGPLRPPNSLFG